MSALERYQAPQRLDEIERLAGHFERSGLFGNSPKTQGEIIVKMLAGAENGFPPFASVQGIHVIQGKPEMGADLLARSVKQSERYDYRVRHINDSECVIEFFEGGESLGLSEFSMKDAERAGLKTQMYGKYPRNMLFARAMSNGVAWYCPDATSTRFYVDGEISGPRPDVWDDQRAVEDAAQAAEDAETVIHEVTVEPAPPVAGEPERVVADQLAALGADGRKRLKAHMRRIGAVHGDERKPQTWISSIIETWSGDFDDVPGDGPMYADLANVLERLDAAFRVETPLTRQAEDDAANDAEIDELFQSQNPDAITLPMYGDKAPS